MRYDALQAQSAASAEAAHKPASRRQLTCRLESCQAPCACRPGGCCDDDVRVAEHAALRRRCARSRTTRARLDGARYQQDRDPYRVAAKASIAAVDLQQRIVERPRAGRRAMCSLAQAVREEPSVLRPLSNEKSRLEARRVSAVQAVKGSFLGVWAGHRSVTGDVECQSAGAPRAQAILFASFPRLTAVQVPQRGRRSRWMALSLPCVPSRCSCSASRALPP